ncbi:hypothetical protein ebA968 [Aromatoleum aromaticum EbN1]|uniref:Uncharacterized protein n=1 Tax=Aromatoleum aromaticum (strain DSM 19018 / LMG 30748 / EbN1) TaxID=76114 RepID=Q5P7S5_AROAE|nr:hypothetical protein ebA968 [Aromatoleum aromaticum EbN1]
MTSIAFSTWRTPRTAIALRCARSRCAAVVTTPASVTCPPSAETAIWVCCSAGSATSAFLTSRCSPRSRSSGGAAAEAMSAAWAGVWAMQKAIAVVVSTEAIVFRLIMRELLVQ